ncbi:MAG: hypothetical protein M0C28_17465 [Candidatus Moduliflexus flocculans]|nr:hypothetical protein [Candidatus Moduliflexus flocculans]
MRRLFTVGTCTRWSLKEAMVQLGTTWSAAAAVAPRSNITPCGEEGGGGGLAGGGAAGGGASEAQRSEGRGCVVGCRAIVRAVRGRPDRASPR